MANPIKKERQFFQRLKSEGLLLWQWLKPYVQKLPKFLWNNKLYIIWFLVYDIITYRVVLGLIPEQQARTMREFYYYMEPDIWHRPAFIFFLVTCFYALSILVAIAFGDIILRAIESVRPIETEEEKEYLVPLFEEICQEVKEAFPEMPKTKLYIIDNQTVNAQAIGRRTVAVTQGAIRTFSRENLKAIIAHEMGHIYNGNTMAILLNTIGNGFFSIAVMLFRLFLLVLDFLQAPFEKQTKGLIHILLDFVSWIVTSLEFVFLFIGNIILMGNSRGAEYQADKFAYQAGYGMELREALYMLQKMSLTDQLKIIERLQASHPRVSRRIMKVEQLLAKE